MDDLIKECNKPFIISPFAFKNNKKAISSTQLKYFKKLIMIFIYLMLLA